MAENKCKFVSQYKCNKKCGLGCLGCKTYNIYCKGLKAGREEKDLPKLKAALFCRTVGRTKAMIDELSKYKHVSVVCLPDYNQFNKLKQATEIIAKKKVSVLLLNFCFNVEEYNWEVSKERKLTQEQFNLIKEVLKLYENS